jgi:hypothetical protein
MRDKRLIISSSEKTITVNNIEYKYILNFKNNRNTYMQINKDGIVVVNASKRNNYALESFVSRNIERMYKHYHNKAKSKYIDFDNDSMYFFGLEYKIFYIVDKKFSYKIENNEIKIYSRKIDNKRILLTKFIKLESKLFFDERFECFTKLMKLADYNFKYNFR